MHARFVPMLFWPDFNSLACIPALFRPSYAPGKPFAVRWGFFPFYYELHMSEEEPDIARSNAARPAPFRFIIWRRLKERGRPKGWSMLPASEERHACVSTEVGSDRTWSKSAKNAVSQWQRLYRARGYTIRDATLDEFVSAYKESVVYKKIKGASLHRHIRIAEQNPGHWRARVAVGPSGEVLGGVLTFHSFAAKCSYYALGFYTSAAKSGPYMYVLIHDWVLWARSVGVEHADMGDVWVKGETESWKGFTAFKHHFRPTIITYSKPYFKIGRWVW